MQFSLPGNIRNLLLGMMGIGLVSIIGAFVADAHYAWANLLLNSFWFTAIALAGTFFVAVHYVGEGGWHIGFKRVPEAMSQYLPIGSLFLFIVVIMGYFHGHHLYHWLDPEVQATDEIYLTSGKKVWLQNEFWLIRTVFYLAGWMFFTMKLRQFSLKEDLEGGLAWHKKSYRWSAAFLVFFAVTSSTASWDWLMSLDFHWFSTLFGWYIFAGFFVSALTLMLLLTLWLKQNGYMPHLNTSHIHDLAKMMFAFSIFWTYLWFSQYMLIWYSNIPEEINYFMERFHTAYQPFMIFMLVINFAFPLLVLMHRDAKRNYRLTFAAGIVVFFGHFLDMYQIIMPGAMAGYQVLLPQSVGMMIGFLGLFLFVTYRALGKAALVPQNHPFLNESKQHHI